jgi:hypothetical protein
LANFVGSVVGFLNVFVGNGRDRSLHASSLPPRYPLKAKWYQSFTVIAIILLTSKAAFPILPPVIPILNQSAIFVGSVVGFLNVFVGNGRDRSLHASSLPPRYHL